MEVGFDDGFICIHLPRYRLEREDRFYLLKLIEHTDTRHKVGGAIFQNLKEVCKIRKKN